MSESATTTTVTWRWATFARRRVVHPDRALFLETVLYLLCAATRHWNACGLLNSGWHCGRRSRWLCWWHWFVARLLAEAH